MASPHPILLPCVTTLLLLLAGCFGSTASPPGTDDPTPLEAEGAPLPSNGTAGEPVTLTAEATGLAVVRHPCPPLGTCWSGAPGGAELDRFPANATKATLTATWEARTPLAAALRVVLANGTHHVAEGEGMSPLVLDVDPDLLKGGRKHTVAFLPASPGLVVDQTVRFELVLEYGPAAAPQE